MRQKLIESPELFKKLNDDVRTKLGMSTGNGQAKPEEKEKEEKAPKEKKPVK